MAGPVVHCARIRADVEQLGVLGLLVDGPGFESEEPECEEVHDGHTEQKAPRGIVAGAFEDDADGQDHDEYDGEE